MELKFLSSLNIIGAVKQSKQKFIEKFKRKYQNEYPPAWKSFELLTFRTLYTNYKNLASSPEQRAISDHFGLNETIFVSWMDCLVYIRNVCAHHASNTIKLSVSA